MSKKSLLLAIGLYVLSSALSFGAFAFFGADRPTSLTPEQQAEQEATSELAALLTIDPKEPADQACPLNGKMFTKTERQAWEKKRPLAVMIENHPEARPQAGLSDADIVFEAMAEGGVTRYMGIFYCGVQKFDTLLAPVRSARSYFIDWASGFNRPLYVHVGGANLPGPADALGQLSDYGWVGENDLNQFSIGYPTFVRNYNRVEGKEIATEHTMETTSEKLWAVGAKREWTNLSPEFKVGKKVIAPQDWRDGYKGFTFEDKPGSAGSVRSISFEFWTGFSEYAVKYEYDATTNAYKRFVAGQPDIDINKNKQVEVSNVIILFTKETGPIDEKKHMLYETTGSDDALIFKNGEVIEATWAKKDRTSELTFTVKGRDVPLARGLTWISVVDNSTEISY